jgi:hypothetical protein
MHITPGRTIIAGALAALAIAAAGAQPATAYDRYPCTLKKAGVPMTWLGHVWKIDKMTCPLTRGHVPVYVRRNPESRVIGELVSGGSANWFVYERTGVETRVGNGKNQWWASTLADNGRWGWVNEAYFKGGRDNEDDRGLLMPGPLTCADDPGTPQNECDIPMPPWR